MIIIESITILVKKKLQSWEFNIWYKKQHNDLSINVYMSSKDTVKLSPQPDYN